MVTRVRIADGTEDTAEWEVGNWPAAVLTLAVRTSERDHRQPHAPAWLEFTRQEQP